MADKKTWKHKLIDSLPPLFAKHYVIPLFTRGKRRPYDPARYFESYYRLVADAEFSDRVTISPVKHPALARFHYNALENSILKYFSTRPHSSIPPAVLDVGAGAGHWIDYYLEVFSASGVVGVEISPRCVEALTEKYRDRENVEIIRGDVSSPDFRLGRSFDVISAIGVMFHVTDDDKWKQALKNLAGHLKEDGVMIVGGQFGLITQDVQFHGRDDFSSFNEILDSRPGELLVNKRIRSRRCWRKAALEAGLVIDGFVKTPHLKRRRGPENNILALKRR